MSSYEIREKIRKKTYAQHEKALQYRINHIKQKKANNLAASISLENKKCVLCGSTRFLVRHHEDYNKPLQVDIVCRSCHANIHNKNRMLSHE